MIHFNAPKPNVPLVFQEIIKNDAKRAEIIELGSSMSQENWRTLKELNTDKKKNLRPSAERALKWNEDKGNTKG